MIDAHHHFWDPSRADYPWMTDDCAAVRRRFGPDDLRPLLTECGVGRTVLVQTRASLAESCEFLATASRTDFIAGVVAWVDLVSAEVAGQLEMLRSSPGGERLVGVRHQVHDEPDPEWLLRPDVLRGLRAVEASGLAYDLLVRTRELPAARRVARDFPGLRLIVDHLAKPPLRTGALGEWAAALAPLAAHGNVWCKLSGLITEADWRRWRPEDLTGCVRQALAWFGEDRLMFGSDWPVCLLAGTYAEVLDAARCALGDLPAAARRKIFGTNAEAAYRLGP